MRVYGQPPLIVILYILGFTNVHHVDMELLEREWVFRFLKENLNMAQMRMKHQVYKHRTKGTLKWDIWSTSSFNRTYKPLWLVAATLSYLLAFVGIQDCGEDWARNIQA